MIAHDPPAALPHAFLEGYAGTGFNKLDRWLLRWKSYSATIMDDILMYQIATPSKPGERPPRRWVVAKYVKPSAEADSWSYTLWDPTTVAVLWNIPRARCDHDGTYGLVFRHH